jgi:Fur family ferric uptake transcriptional regulator
MIESISSLTDALQEEGYRLTPARQAIVTMLVSCRGHISADGLFELVHQGTPGIGRMTVYRTLELLTDLGLIRPVYQGTAAAHYILLADGHHHHLVCSSCKRVIEIEQCLFPEIEQAVRSRYQFDMEGHLLEIYGRCGDCRIAGSG